MFNMFNMFDDDLFNMLRHVKAGAPYTYTCTSHGRLSIAFGGNISINLRIKNIPKVFF